MINIRIVDPNADDISKPMHMMGLSGMARRVPEYGDLWFGLVGMGSVGFLLLLLSVLWWLRLGSSVCVSVFWGGFK